MKYSLCPPFYQKEKQGLCVSREIGVDAPLFLEVQNFVYLLLTLEVEQGLERAVMEKVCEA